MGYCLVGAFQRRRLLETPVSDIWYELPEAVTFSTVDDVIYTGCFPFKTDVSFTLYADFTNNTSYPMYDCNTNATAVTGMRGGGKSAGNTDIFINGTQYKASGVKTKMALSHEAGSGTYKYYFSKTGTTVTKAFNAYTKQIKLGGTQSNRDDLKFKGTIRKFIIYKRCLTDTEIETLWDGGVV